MKDNKYHIEDDDLVAFHNLMADTNCNMILKKGWLGNAIYDSEENFIISYLEWKQWDIYFKSFIFYYYK